MIVDVDDNELCTIACPSGLLKGKYSRHQFDLCPHRLLLLDDVNRECKVSLRSAVSNESSTGGNCGEQRSVKQNAVNISKTIFCAIQDVTQA